MTDKTAHRGRAAPMQVTHDTPTLDHLLDFSGKTHYGDFRDGVFVLAHTNVTNNSLIIVQTLFAMAIASLRT